MSPVQDQLHNIQKIPNILTDLMAKRSSNPCNLGRQNMRRAMLYLQSDASVLKRETAIAGLLQPGHHDASSF